MPSPSIQHEPAREYLDIVERVERIEPASRSGEEAEIDDVVFGPEGVGKSRLLQTFVDGQSLALYVGQTRSPREFLLELHHSMSLAIKGAKALGDLSSLSTRSLKGSCIGLSIPSHFSW